MNFEVRQAHSPEPLLSSCETLNMLSNSCESHFLEGENNNYLVGILQG